MRSVVHANLLVDICRLCFRCSSTTLSDEYLHVLRGLWRMFFFQAEDGIRDLVRSRGLGDVYKRQVLIPLEVAVDPGDVPAQRKGLGVRARLVEVAQGLSLIHI